MKITHHLRNAIIGWIAGLLITIAFSWLWHQILPAKEQEINRPTLMLELLMILVQVTPFAIAGGVIGGRLPREGGIRQQVITAILFGGLFILPVACFLFWYQRW